MSRTKELTVRQLDALGAGEHAVGGTPGLSIIVGGEPGRGRWVLRYRMRKPGGGWIKRTLPIGEYPAITLKGARQQAAELRVQIRNGEDPLRQREERRTVATETVADLVSEFFAGHPTLARKTVLVYRSAAERFVDHVGTRSPVAAITPEALDAYSKRFLPRKLASAQSRNKERRAIKTILRWAARTRRISLSTDEVTWSLEAEKGTASRKDYLRPREIREVLEAAMAHDAETFAITREEHAGLRPMGTTPRHAAITPFIMFLLLTGCRRGEALSLEWPQVDLDAADVHGNPLGAIEVTAESAKAKTRRVIYLDVSPALHRLLCGMRREEGRVFADLTEETARRARDRLVKRYGSPEFTFHGLRRTCETFLVYSAVYGSQARALDLAARQLGHSIEVADRHYVGDMRGIESARTLEEAMRIEELIAPFGHPSMSSTVPKSRASPWHPAAE